MEDKSTGYYEVYKGYQYLRIRVKETGGTWSLLPQTNRLYESFRRVVRASFSSKLYCLIKCVENSAKESNYWSIFMRSILQSSAITKLQAIASECSCYMDTYTHIYTHTYIHIYIHIHVNIYIHNYIHIYMHTYIYIHIYIYTHKYMHRHIYILEYIWILEILSVRKTICTIYL